MASMSRSGNFLNTKSVNMSMRISDVVKALVAAKLKKSPRDISMGSTIKSLASGKK